MSSFCSLTLFLCMSLWLLKLSCVSQFTFNLPYCKSNEKKKREFVRKCCYAESFTICRRHFLFLCFALLGLLFDSVYWLPKHNCSEKTRKRIIWKTIKCLTERSEQAYGTVFLFILIFPQLIFFNQKTVISGYLIRDFFLIFDDGIHSNSKIKKLWLFDDKT